MSKLWFKLSDKIRFAIIGCINALICYLIYAFFIFILGNNYYQISLALAWGISSITSFFTHRYFVFRAKGNVLKEYFKCCITWIIAYSINAILLEIFVSKLNLNVYLSQIIAPAIAGIFTYFMFKKVAFTK